MLPVYRVEWRGNILKSRPTVERAVVVVTVFGATKELVELSILDDSLFLRPRISLQDLRKLLEIPDEKFLLLSNQEKAELVHQTAGYTNVPLHGIFEETSKRKQNSTPTQPDRTNSSEKQSRDANADAKLEQRRFQVLTNAGPHSRTDRQQKKTKTLPPTTSNRQHDN